MNADSLAAPLARPLWRDRALVLAGIAMSAFNLRTAVTSLTPLLDRLGENFGFGSTMTGVLGMVPTAAFALFGVVTPAIAHRLGLERTALLSMVLAALGLFVRAFVGDTAMLLVTSALALSGMGMGNVVLPPLVKRYFADRVGTVSTLYITVLQLGTILPALLAVPLAQAAGWRVSLGAWSLIAAAAALPWIGVLWMERYGHSRQAQVLANAHYRAVAPGDEAPELDGAKQVDGRVWRSPVAWGLTLMFGMTSLTTYSMFTWLPRLLVEAGGSPALGGTMVALFSTMGLLSALVLPALAVRIANPFPIVVACGVSYLAAFAGLLLAPMAAPLLWVALLGLGPSTFPLSLTLINLRTRTPGGSSRLSGFVQGVGYSLSCLGPLLFGWLHASTRGWAGPFAFLALCLLALLYGGWLASKPRMLEDTW
ncbi:MFS transporter [Lysobacter sp. MMG2]|uniref:MFS transporter n=1 Tax=Lysobacter sp. MMG2 TaxID=2801338 RepID=UPI001C24070E|nr:MFS transporter [Lysobacter sp. MMG2]MBU8977551.1 MFS transporter [Lysobacter sp. MMG2]